MLDAFYVCLTFPCDLKAGTDLNIKQEHQTDLCGLFTVWRLKKHLCNLATKRKIAKTMYILLEKKR